MFKEIMKESRIIIIWLSEKRDNIPEDLSSDILCIDVNDIELLKKVKLFLIKQYGGPWIFVNTDNTFEFKQDYLDNLKKIERNLSNQEYERILDLIERKLPVEFALSLFEGDKNELHTHKIYPPKETDYQVEIYLVPEMRSIQLEFKINEKVELLKLSGPSLIIFGDVPHRRLNGECFVIKHIRGKYKQTEQM